MNEQSTATSQGTFTDADFDRVAGLYGSESKRKRVLDALAAYGVDDRDSLVAECDEIIGLLQSMAEHGAGYTPPSGKGFGSDNAAVIAEKILGQAQTVGATRKAFAEWGKNGVR